MKHNFLLPIFLCLLSACASKPAIKQDPALLGGDRLESVATFVDQQPTGLAIDERGRIFVSFPRWSLPVQSSVAEVDARGRLTPFPDRAWNRWRQGQDDPAKHFICVQSVVADGADSLWVLDPASPGFRGVVPGGAKLVQINLRDNRVVRIYAFGPLLAPEDSYLNDVRVDPEKKLAFITDSGAGALLVVDLETGLARRILDREAALHYDPKQRPVIGGRPWLRPDGAPPKVHVDGIALDRDRGLLYLHPLTGKNLIRIPVSSLANPDANDGQLSKHIDHLGPDVISDGMEVDAQGRIYLTALEHDAIMRRSPDGKKLETLIRDPRLRWPDSLAWGPDGKLYVTTSQIHLGPRFRDEQGRPYPFGLWRIRLKE